MKVLLERFPYRYVESGTLEINGMPDYRIQKADAWTKRYKDMYLLDNQMQLLTAMDDFEYTKRYSDMYLLDNQMQLLTAIDDFEYTKWLDPEGVPAYVKDTVSSTHN